MSAAIDPASINSWKDAFQHHIPQVRQLEKQLRAELASNKEKLRSLVGESYRELLETADRIVQMDVNAHLVEANLSEASRNCNARLLDRKARNLKAFQQSVGAEDREKYRQAAQLDILQKSPGVLLRLVAYENGEQILLAAKVYILSRLILKTFGEQNPAPFLSSLRTQLSTLRPLLLRHLDGILSSEESDAVSLVAALTAFSLVKTASPTDVFRHFLHVRTHSFASDAEIPDPATVISHVALFNKTLGDVESIFPQKRSKALVMLKSKSLVYNEDLFSIAELGLDVNARWLPQDIRGFIPWIQHDDLTSSKVDDMLKSWATKEGDNLSTMFAKSLEGVESIRSAVTVRNDILTVWRAGGRLRRKYLPGKDLFRESAMKRVASLISAQAADVQAQFQGLKSIVAEAPKEAQGSTSLWSDALLNMDISAGAIEFRETVSRYVEGRGETVGKFMDSYQAWSAQITETVAIIDGLRVSAGPTDEEEDFDAEEDRLQSGVEDAEQAETELVNALDRAFHECETSFNSIVDELSEEHTAADAEKSEEELRRSVLLLRIARQLVQKPPARKDSTVLVPLNWFAAPSVAKLLQIISTSLADKLVRNMKSSLSEWDKPSATHALWEGSPPLPSQCSPLIAHFLHEVVRTMSSVGEDIWTPSAVKSLKAALSETLWKALLPVLENRKIIEEPTAEDRPASPEPPKKAHEDDEKKEASTDAAESTTAEPTEGAASTHTSVEGDQAAASASGAVCTDGAEPDPQRRITREWAIQLLFDAIYLDEALQRRHQRGRSNGVSMNAKVDSVFAADIHMDEEMRMRLEGSASEYWKKTQLLFSLLNC